MYKNENKIAGIDCQLEAIFCIGSELTFSEKKIIKFKKNLKYIVSTIKRIATDPHILLRKLISFFKLGKNAAQIADSKGISNRNIQNKITSLKLKEGEKVRIKLYEEILKTLDERGRYDGLAYISSAMNKYCGGIYKVRKRVNYFFDERNWKMSKLRDVVILEEVCCESALNERQDWAGCDRTCFLFWKEAWLEKISEEWLESC